MRSSLNSRNFSNAVSNLIIRQIDIHKSALSDFFGVARQNMVNSYETARSCPCWDF